MSIAPEFRAALVRGLKAGTRGVAIATDDEVRAVALLEDVGRDLGWPVHTWSSAAGLDGGGSPRVFAELMATLRSRRDDAIIIVVLDALAAIIPRGAGEAAALRTLRELCQRSAGPAVVLVDPDGVHEAADLGARIPELWVEALPLPDRDELLARLDSIATALEESGWANARTRMSASGEALARAGLGLPAHAFERMLAEAVIAHGPDPEALERALSSAKPRAIVRGSALEHLAPGSTDEIGGLDVLKGWLALRRRALAPEARAAGIPFPRGVLLLGVQGCGKSLAARACAGVLGLPLLRLDPGRLFGGTVGASEANLRRMLHVADRAAPAVLWIDEIDKGFAGSEGAASDAGTAARVLGGLLTWLQERTQPVFVVATANRIDALPPELLRRGRLDEIFFVDLPDADEREAILRVHAAESHAPARRGATVDGFAALVRAAEGRSGAEIAAAVADARLRAFADGRTLTPADLAAALDEIIPLSVVRAEEIAALRTWAARRARRA
jgi:MoxR-like ATPase